MIEEKDFNGIKSYLRRYKDFAVDGKIFKMRLINLENCSDFALAIYIICKCDEYGKKRV